MAVAPVGAFPPAGETSLPWPMENEFDIPTGETVVLRGAEFGYREGVHRVAIGMNLASVGGVNQGNLT